LWFVLYGNWTFGHIHYGFLQAKLYIQVPQYYNKAIFIAKTHPTMLQASYIYSVLNTTIHIIHFYLEQSPQEEIDRMPGVSFYSILISEGWIVNWEWLRLQGSGFQVLRTGSRDPKNQ